MVCNIEPQGSEKEWGAGRRSCDGEGDGRDAIALGGGNRVVRISPGGNREAGQ